MTVLGSFSATEMAAEHIRGLIVNEELAPGTKINLDEFAEKLGMSRTPVRDALTRLQAEGLVQIVARVGVYVREISVEEVLEVYSIKAALEPLMVQWATERASQEERDAFADSAQDLVALAEAPESGPYIDLILARRRRMIELARSDVLTASFRQIDERVRPLRDRNLGHGERRLASCQEHLAIAEAVRAGDGERAAELTRRHVLSARSALVELTKRSHGDSSETGVA